MYKQVKTPESEIAKTILRLSDNAYIPFDPSNTDYHAYIKGLEEGNTPLPAEEA